MSMALKKEPPGDHPGIRTIDGGLALRHGFQTREGPNHWIAFTLEELIPIPNFLYCPVCDRTDAISPRIKLSIKKLQECMSQGG